MSPQFNAGFGIPPVTKYLLGINILLFVAKYVVAGSIDLDHYLALYYFKSQYFRPYQFVTHMFVHAGFAHILFNMLGLFSFGSILESLWGSKRFLNFYVLCGLGAALAQLGSNYYSDIKLSEMVFTEDDAVTYKQIIDNMGCVGASGAIFGLLGGFALLFPNAPISIFILPPMKAKYMIGIYAAISIIFGFGGAVITGFPGSGIAHFAHLGGLVVGLIIVYIWRRSGTKLY